MNKFNQSQFGRSMVEMLGVLAVMGVLSVGGVAMYTSAMNKHRANEILNEVSKRAVMVAGQLLTNPSATTMSLAQFGSNAVAGATFGENATISNGKITLTVSGVENAVCNQMIAATGTNSAMQVAPGCGTITFNTDMSKGGTTGGSTDSIDTGTCTNGNVWESYAEEGHECDTATPANMGCTKNSDCVSAEKCSAGAGKCYCKITGKQQNGCAEITGGTCETLDAGRETTYTDPNDTKKTKTFLVSSDYMTWWAAENWCKAHHKNLVSYSTVNSLFDCDKKNENSCRWSKFETSSYWSNGILSEYYWTAESYDSCYAWFILIWDNIGWFNGDGHSFSKFVRNGEGSVYALCE